MNIASAKYTWIVLDTFEIQSLWLSIWNRKLIEWNIGYFITRLTGVLACLAFDLIVHGNYRTLMETVLHRNVSLMK